MKQGKAMEQRIREYNESQVSERENLPNLLELIKEVQQGERTSLELYYYGHKEVERFPYDGKMQAYEISKVQFWDKPLNIWLGHVKRRYTKQTSVGEMGGYDGRKISYKVNVSNFEESEIDSEWYEWFLAFCYKINLENFVKETESKTLNAVRKYIRAGFENHLKKVNNEKIGLERVRVDGNLYYVKNKQEEVFFEDIYIGQDDDGESISFLDIVQTQDTTGFDISDITFSSKKFIEENLEETLTKKQLEKWNVLVEYVEQHGIETILDKYTGKIQKAKVQRIIYPDKTYKNTERVDSLIKIMNQRMEKQLVKAGVGFVAIEDEGVKSTPKESKSGEVTTYTGGFTEAEVEVYFQRHLEGILRAFREGRLTFVKGSEAMLPSLESMNELPFDTYEEFRKGGDITRLNIIKEYYNKDKFKMKAGTKTIIDKSKPVEVVERNAKYIDPTKLAEIRKESQANKVS